MTDSTGNSSFKAHQDVIRSAICGFQVSSVGLKQNLNIMDSMADSGQGGWVVTLNTEMLAKCSREKDYVALLMQADLITADGMPLIWASQHNGQPSISGRTTGVDIVERILQRTHIPNFAIIGGLDPETTLKRYPNALEACKYLFTGAVDLSEQQTEEFASTLRETKTKYVFLALGVPKQDKLALALRKKYPEAVLIGIGGTFEILSKSGGRAPRWMQKSGLEWFYRLVKEPRRLWKRYILNYPTGLSALIKDSLKK